MGKYSYSIEINKDCSIFNIENTIIPCNEYIINKTCIHCDCKQNFIKGSICYGYDDINLTWNCTLCGIDIGSTNPRQYCCKGKCDNFY
jgi:hypothetical protein